MKSSSKTPNDKDTPDATYVNDKQTKGAPSRPPRGQCQAQTDGVKLKSRFKTTRFVVGYYIKRHITLYGKAR
ncbi:hypothetical protein SBV1_810054 [Verrucomicrobia bacterium]|nr:hypothetical protein SBV1_810054 [Verrucomicrobiota bacterium]